MLPKLSGFSYVTKVIKLSTLWIMMWKRVELIKPEKSTVLHKFSTWRKLQSLQKSLNEGFSTLCWHVNMSTKDFIIKVTDVKSQPSEESNIP